MKKIIIFFSILFMVGRLSASEEEKDEEEESAQESLRNAKKFHISVGKNKNSVLLNLEYQWNAFASILVGFENENIHISKNESVVIPSYNSAFQGGSGTGYIDKLYNFNYKSDEKKTFLGVRLFPFRVVPFYLGFYGGSARGARGNFTNVDIVLNQGQPLLTSPVSIGNFNVSNSNYFTMSIGFKWMFGNFFIGAEQGMTNYNSSTHTNIKFWRYGISDQAQSWYYNYINTRYLEFFSNKIYLQRENLFYVYTGIAI